MMVYLCTITLAALLLPPTATRAAVDVNHSSDNYFMADDVTATGADDSTMAERLSTVVGGTAATSLDTEFIEVEHQGRTRDTQVYRL